MLVFECLARGLLGGEGESWGEASSSSDGSGSGVLGLGALGFLGLGVVGGILRLGGSGS